jgi:hypothetical protein
MPSDYCRNSSRDERAVSTDERRRQTNGAGVSRRTSKGTAARDRARMAASTQTLEGRDHPVVTVAAPIQDIDAFSVL